MSQQSPDPWREAIALAVQDAGLDASCAPATGYSGCEIVLGATGPAQAKVIVLAADEGTGIRLTVRAFMFRQYSKHVSISDRSEIGYRRFPPDRISRDWLRHQIALAARAAMAMCEPAHQEKLRSSAVAVQRKR